MIFGNPFLGRGWIEEYYTESRLWTAPPGINNLIRLEMRGGTGIASGYAFTPVAIAVRRIGAGYLHQISKATLNSEALTEYNKFPSTPSSAPPNGVSVTWNQTHYTTGGPAKSGENPSWLARLCSRLGNDRQLESGRCHDELEYRQPYGEE